MVKGSRESSQSRPQVPYLNEVGCGVWQRYKASEYSARWYRVKVYALADFYQSGRFLIPEEGRAGVRQQVIAKSAVCPRGLYSRIVSVGLCEYRRKGDL